MSTSDPADTSTTAPGSETTTLAGTSGTAGDADGDTGSSSTAASSGTGSDLVTSPNNMYAALVCNGGQPEPDFYVEAYDFDEVHRACVPPPDVGEDLLTFVVADWDGEAGTFEFTPEGPHHANVGFRRPEGTTGSIEIFTAAPYTPISAHVIIDGELEGELDFTVCPPTPIELPCPPR